MAGDIVITTKALTGLGTEDTYTIPAYCNGIRMQPRTNGVRVKTTAGGAYWTIAAGQWHRISAMFTSQPIYLESTVAVADTLEIIEEYGKVLP